MHYVSCIPNSSSKRLDQLCWHMRLSTGALHIDNKPAIQLLVEGGADLLAKNKSGETPLVVAMKKGENNGKNIKTLVFCSKQEEINAEDGLGCTALHYLAQMKDGKREFLTDLTKV